MKLTPRLEAVCEFVNEGSRIADIGTDHAYIPIYLMQSGKITYAAASDINEGPIKAANENIKKSGCENIRTYLAPGLTAIGEDEVDTIIIAGMGGDLISDILDEKLPRSASRIILQPMTHIKEARMALHRHLFEIKEERLVMEGKRLYTVISAEKGQPVAFSDFEYEISPGLYGDPLFKELLRREKERLERNVKNVRMSGNNALSEEFSKKLLYIEKILEEMG